jgi:hypothetical protein
MFGAFLLVLGKTPHDETQHGADPDKGERESMVPGRGMVPLIMRLAPRGAGHHPREWLAMKEGRRVKSRQEWGCNV